MKKRDLLHKVVVIIPKNNIDIFELADSNNEKYVELMSSIVQSGEFKMIALEKFNPYNVETVLKITKQKGFTFAYLAVTPFHDKYHFFTYTISPVEANRVLNEPFVKVLLSSMNALFETKDNKFSKTLSK